MLPIQDSTERAHRAPDYSCEDRRQALRASKNAAEQPGSGAKTADAKKTSGRPKGSEAKADSPEQKKGSADGESKGKRKSTKGWYRVCGDPDHIARNCPKKKVKAQQSVDANVQRLVQGRPTGLLLDTGAGISVVKEAIAKDCPTRPEKLGKRAGQEQPLRSSPGRTEWEDSARGRLGRA